MYITCYKTRNNKHDSPCVRNVFPPPPLRILLLLVSSSQPPDVARDFCSLYLLNDILSRGMRGNCKHVLHTMRRKKEEGRRWGWEGGGWDGGEQGQGGELGAHVI
eukprot:768810-Hanusia_phi.AAC.9